MSNQLFPIVTIEYGPATLGAYLSSMIYGSTVLQLVYYFCTYPQDNLWIKLTVLSAFLIDSTQLALTIFALYEATLVHWGDTSIFGFTPMTNFFVRILAGATFGTVLLAPITQIIWLWRIWTLEKSTIRSRLLKHMVIIFLSSLIAAQIASMLLFAVQTTRLALRPDEAKPFAIVALAMMSATDLCLAITMSLVLHRSRSGLVKTNVVLTRLIVYTLANGLLATTFNLATLILFIHPFAWGWMGVFFVEERLYVCSLLATLNIRNTLRKSSGTFQELREATQPLTFSRPKLGSIDDFPNIITSEPGHYTDSC